MDYIDKLSSIDIGKFVKRINCKLITPFINDKNEIIMPYAKNKNSQGETSILVRMEKLKTNDEKEIENALQNIIGSKFYNTVVNDEFSTNREILILENYIAYCPFCEDEEFSKMVMKEYNAFMVERFGEQYKTDFENYREGFLKDNDREIER